MQSGCRRLPTSFNTNSYSSSTDVLNSFLLYHSLILSFRFLSFFYMCVCGCCVGTLKQMHDSSIQVSMMEKDFYLGRILTGRISSGIIRVGDKVHGLRRSDSGVDKLEEGKVCGNLNVLNYPSRYPTLRHLYILSNIFAYLFAPTLILFSFEP